MRGGKWEVARGAETKAYLSGDRSSEKNFSSTEARDNGKGGAGGFVNSYNLIRAGRGGSSNR